MKILLVRLKPHKETIGLQHVMICEPLEYEYLVSNHKTSADVEIIDMIIERKKLKFFIENRKPDLVVFSGYISLVNQIRESAESVKKMNPNIKVLVGGVHAEVNPTDFVSPHIDFIACSNGIDTFKEIVQNFGLDREAMIEKVAGLYKKGRSYNRKTEFHYAHPDRKSVEKYRSSYYYMFHNPCALIKTSFGCQFACSFCFCKEITGGTFYERDLDDVISEIKGIKETEIYIVDDNFLYGREKLLKFAKLLKLNQIDKRFLVYGRADFIAGNPDVIEALKAVGLRAVIVGLESNNDETLDQFNKHTSKAMNERAVGILKENDIELYATLVISMNFKKEDFESLEKWLNDLDITFVNLQPLTPLKGTSIYKDHKKDFIIHETEFEKWDLAHVVLKPEHMSIRMFYFNLLRTYYSVVMAPHKLVRLVKKYGVYENVKMFLGSSRVSLQYMKKIIRG